MTGWAMRALISQEAHYKEVQRSIARVKNLLTGKFLLMNSTSLLSDHTKMELFGQMQSFFCDCHPCISQKCGGSIMLRGDFSPAGTGNLSKDDMKMGTGQL
ncbi:hypothetical protein CHARACLAT_007714 [Characodon lateralis]|uniref:Uncharacterized protein n=1 Tax=Characodon lateralis TaxID=208331 RepID=A0ABU7E7V6_9TELE|nr:hypothetical protein [Characodon lateralis]